MSGQALAVVGRVFASIVRYVKERRERQEALLFRNYLEWRRRRDHEEVINKVEDVESLVQDNQAVVSDLLEQVEKIVGFFPDEGDGVDVLNVLHGGDLLPEASPGFQEVAHRIRLSLSYLEMVISACEGPGVRMALPSSDSIAKGGTLTFLWRVGGWVDLLLVDVLGGVMDNRVSLLQRSTGEIELRVKDDLGVGYSLRSSPVPTERLIHVALVWDGQSFEIFVNSESCGRVMVGNPLRRLGKYLHVGIDIDGELGADVIRQGYTVDGWIGLNLEKQGVWKGNRISDIAVFAHQLSPARIQAHTVAATLAETELRRTANQRLEHSFGMVRAMDSHV